MGRKREFESYVKDLKQASKYKEEIDKICVKHKINEKKEFIKSTKEFLKDKNFLEMLGHKIGQLLDEAKEVNMDDEFYAKMDSFNIDIEKDYFYFDGIELYSDNCWYYKDTWHDYNEDKEDIGTIPYNVDLIGLIKCLEELEVIYKERRKEIRAEKERLAEIKKREEEAAEYELYLQLKEKYEKKA